MKTPEVQKLYSEFILPTYTQVPVCLVKGKGSRVWDTEGREYLDFFPGWAVSVLGHCHPRVINAMRHQMTKIVHISNNFLNLKQAQLAEEISGQAFPARCFFCSSGAEATEAAIKFARRYGSAENRYEIITMKKSFHGRTLGAVAATGQERIRQGFDPVLSGFKHADFNDLESVRAAVTDRTVAIFLEPIQGEGGIHVASESFMKGLRSLCDERKLLLILDEVQTGIGRTGRMFAFQHYGIEPDLMTLAKGLGNGVPIGALVTHRKLPGDVLTPGTHGSTYGGNPLVAAAALAVFRTIRKEKLLKNAEIMGRYLKEQLENLKAKHPVVAEVRGIGLMQAMELREPGAEVANRAREKGLLINCTQQNVLRIMPAITVSKKIIDRAASLLDKTLAECFEGAAL